MKQLLPFLCCLTLIATTVQAKDEFASAKEAETMVGNAASAIKANKQKTLEEITAKNSKWVDRDLYVTVYTMEGKVLAHGQNAKMVGKDLIDFKDPEGKPFIKERVELAKQKNNFWQDYVFTDPISHKPLAKKSYCEKTEDVIICGGIYKR